MNSLTISPYTKMAGIMIFAAGALLAYFLWTQPAAIEREDVYVAAETRDSEQTQSEAERGLGIPSATGFSLSRHDSGILYGRSGFQDSRMIQRQNSQGERVSRPAMTTEITRLGPLSANGAALDTALYGRVSRAALAGDYGAAADILTGSGRGRAVMQATGQNRIELRATIQRGFESIMRDHTVSSPERGSSAYVIESEVTRLMNDPKVVELGAVAGVGRADLEVLVRQFLSAKAQQASPSPGFAPNNVQPLRYEPLEIRPKQ